MHVFKICAADFAYNFPAKFTHFTQPAIIVRSFILNELCDVRVQAVIDGQGIALWDDLVKRELESGELCYLSDITIEEAGYFLLYMGNQNQRSTVIQKFSDWICDQQ